MVLKVEDEALALEQTTPILDSNTSSKTRDSEIKLQIAYEDITRSLKADPLLVERPIVALQLFLTAIKEQNVQLAKQCIENLNSHLNKNNVLFILEQISKCKTEYSDPYDVAPSAPPIVEDEYECNDGWIQDIIDNLRNNCFLEIDKNAEFVLRQKEILELNYSDILNITMRDSLEISSEIIVYSTIMRWCIEECRKRILQPNKNNFKAVLRDLVYAPRYGLMTKKEFLCRTIEGISGPYRSGILDKCETERILEYIKNKGRNRTLNELPHKGGVPRKVGYENHSTFQSVINRDSHCSTKSSCDKFIINFLTCWTAVFD